MSRSMAPGPRTRLVLALLLAVVAQVPVVAASAAQPLCEDTAGDQGRFAVPGLSILLPGLESAKKCLGDTRMLPNQVVQGEEIVLPIPHPDALAGHTLVAGFGSAPLAALYEESPNARVADAQNVAGFLAQRMRQQLGPPRFRALRFEGTPAEFLGERCVRVDSAHEDRGVPGFEGEPFVLTETEYFCLHPSEDLVVWATYSERLPPDREPVPGFADLMERILGRLQFEPLDGN